MSLEAPIGWPTAQRISDIPAVHAALEAFSHDSTEDNAVGLICEVLNATPLTVKPGPPAAWQVWWGIMEKKAIWPPFATEEEAKQEAARIKSNTEIRPLYASLLALPAEADKLDAERWRDAVHMLVGNNFPHSYLRCRSYDETVRRFDAALATKVKP